MRTPLLPPDENNRVRLAANCMLARNGTHTVLVDTGYGDKYLAGFLEQRDEFSETLVDARDGLVILREFRARGRRVIGACRLDQR